VLTDGDLLALYHDPESDRVERKESAQNRDRICQAICALANDLPQHRVPGVVFIGQRDDLSCAGLQVDDELLLSLANLRSDGRLLPFPTMTVRAVALDGCRVAVVEVEPSHNPPIKFEGRVWIRVGPRRAIATAEEERRLVEKRRWGELPFDAHPVRGATMAELDLARFQLEFLPAAISPEALAQNERTVDDQLRALRLARPDGTPTVTAILVIGKEPRSWIPGAYIQFLRVDGPNLVDPMLDNREIAGTVTDQLRQMDDIVRLHIARAATVGGPRRVDARDYPEEALRQLIRNAVLHRTYEGTHAPVRVTWFDDRVEIQSPGGPYGRVTRQTFGQPGVTDYRNPTLAEALKSLGFIERFGVGFAIVRHALSRNGNPDLELTVEDAHILAAIRRKT
jgi:ATP-dependent DNA helicase RecG